MQTRVYHLRYRPLWLAIGWMIVLLIVYLSLATIEIPVPGDQGDKVGHLIAYGVLMLWFAQLYGNAKQRYLLAALCVSLGIALEFAQLLLTDTRTFSLADMAADGAGVCLGWLAAPPRGFAFLRTLEDSRSGRE